MGVSATIAKPRRHVAKIWFGEESREQDVRHVDADRSKNQVPMGLLHHILVKDRQHASTIGSLVDLTSAVIHHRRHPSMERPTLGNGTDYGRLQKTIGFADSHEIVGNWYSYMLDNEVTSAAARMPNETTTMRKPYNQWHDAPLSCHEGVPMFAIVVGKGRMLQPLSPFRRTSSILSKPSAYLTQDRKSVLN